MTHSLFFIPRLTLSPAAALWTAFFLGTPACSVLFDVAPHTAGDAGMEPIDANWVPLDAGLVSVVLQIQDGNDHAEQRCRFVSSCTNNPSNDPSDVWATDLNANDLKLSNFGGSGNRYVGLRYQNVPVCPRCEIVGAHIQFTASTSGAEDTTLSIRAERAADAPVFAASPTNLSDRDLTGQGTTWAPAPWLQGGDALEAQRTPSITAAIQDVVDRSDWEENNALVLILVGKNGRRTASGFNDGAAPELHLTFMRAPPSE